MVTQHRGSTSSCRALTWAENTAYQSARECLDKSLIALLALRLRCGKATIRQWRIGCKPEPYEQGQGLGGDLGLLIELSKPPVDAVKAAAERCFELLRIVGRHE